TAELSGTTAEGSLVLAMAEWACWLCLAPEAFDVVAAAVDAISGTAYGGGDAEAAAAARAVAVDAVAEVVQRGRAAASRVLARMHAKFALGTEDLEYIAARRQATVSNGGSGGSGVGRDEAGGLVTLRWRGRRRRRQRRRRKRGRTEVDGGGNQALQDADERLGRGGDRSESWSQSGEDDVKAVGVFEARLDSGGSGGGARTSGLHPTSLRLAQSAVGVQRYIRNAS
ncbi:hypothetical protein HK405_001191, partial [Cladochytrium tenue]